VVARFTGGWVKLHREILTHWIGQDGYALAIWSTLIGWAHHEDRSTKVPRQGLTKLKRGQLITSATELAETLGFERMTVTRRLDELEKDGCIVQQVSNHGRIITICNYDKYQGREEGTCATSVQPDPQPRTQPDTHILKKERNEEVKKHNAAPKAGRFVFEPDDISCALWFREQHQARNPHARTLDKVNMEAWANEIRLQRESGFTLGEIQGVMSWVLGNDFWRPNVQSPQKLRKQWDLLTARMISENRTRSVGY